MSARLSDSCRYRHPGHAPFKSSARAAPSIVGSAHGAAVMLRVTTLYASSAEATAGYYTQYLAQAPGEEPGVWVGYDTSIRTTPLATPGRRIA